jgi:hypothetical protein
MGMRKNAKLRRRSKTLHGFVWNTGKHTALRSLTTLLLALGDGRFSLFSLSHHQTDSGSQSHEKVDAKWLFCACRMSHRISSGTGNESWLLLVTVTVHSRIQMSNDIFSMAQSLRWCKFASQSAVDIGESCERSPFPTIHFCIARLELIMILRVTVLRFL